MAVESKIKLSLSAMKSEILRFLKKYKYQLPNEVDRIIVSAFVSINNIRVKNNRFIKAYLIDGNCGDKEQETFSDFLSIVSLTKSKLDFEDLIQIFEFVVSPADKIVNGAVYTPDFIRQYIVSRSLEKTSKDLCEIKAADLSCGCGGFLLSLATDLKKRTGKSYKKIFRENLYGIDITEYSITRAKILLSLWAIINGEDEKEFTFNLYYEDALTFCLKENVSELKKNDGLDLIIGNPPYVCSRNMNSDTLAIVKNLTVGKTGHPDLYIPFFQIGVEQLSNSGILGYITVNTFIKSVNGRGLRDYLSEQKIDLTILNFGGEQIFEDRNTYTCICFIQNKKGSVNYIRIESQNLEKVNFDKLSKFEYSDFNNKDGWNLVNSKSTSSFIKKVESTGVPFKDLYTTKNGIATLKNDVYKFKPETEDKNYYYIVDEGKTYSIEKEICRDIVNANKLKERSDLNRIREKIIFPYDKNIRIISQKSLKENFPGTYAYLLSKKKILSQRDKGNRLYEEWFAYGRKQSMDINAFKLFFPHICERPTFVLCEEKDLLFYNGIAIISQDLEELRLIKKILESSIFFKYIKQTTKDYSSGYISMSRNYLKNFGVAQLNDKQKKTILNSDNCDQILEKLYNVSV